MTIAGYISRSIIISISFIALLFSPAAGARDFSISTTTSSGRTITVSAIFQEIFKVTNVSDTEIPRPPVLTHETKYNVILNNIISTDTVGSRYSLSANESEVVLNRRSGELTFRLPNRESIIDFGKRSITDSTYSLQLYVPQGGKWLGGDGTGDTLDFSGDTIRLCHEGLKDSPEAGNKIYPFFYSTLGYALLFDYEGEAEIIFNKRSIEYRAFTNRPVNYYLLTRSFNRMHFSKSSLYDLQQMSTGLRLPSSKIRSSLLGLLTIKNDTVYPGSVPIARQPFKPIDSWENFSELLARATNCGLNAESPELIVAIDPTKAADNQDYELYIRLLQANLFGNHFIISDIDSSKLTQKQKNIIDSLHNRRLRMLPYIYSLWETHSDFYPVPINYYDKDNIVTTDCQDQFLWGREMMTAPVSEKGMEKRQITFQGKHDWYDFNNPTKIYRDTTLIYEAPLSLLPCFIREGSIIATADYPMRSITDYRTDMFTIEIFPSLKDIASFVLPITNPSTDSDSHGYLDFLSGQDGNEIYLFISDSGENKNDNTHLTIKYHNISSPPKKIFDQKGRIIQFKYDSLEKCLIFDISFKTGSEMDLKILLPESATTKRNL